MGIGGIISHIVVCRDRHKSVPQPTVYKRSILVSRKMGSSTVSKSLLERTSSSPAILIPCAKAKVGFTSVQIREYPRILGDNPSVSTGPPITLSWNYDEATAKDYDIDEWECKRCNVRRNKIQFRTPESIRTEWLLDAGYSITHVQQAVNSIKKEQEAQRTSLMKSRFHDKADFMAENFRNSLARLRGKKVKNDVPFAELRYGETHLKQSKSKSPPPSRSASDIPCGERRPLRKTPSFMLFRRSSF